MRILTITLLLLSLAAPAAAAPFMSPKEVSPASGYTKTILLKGLAHPWSMLWLPNDDMLITERPGRVLRWDGQALSKVSGGPDVLAEGQGGLLDISLHPDFKNNQLVYFTLATGTKDANQTALARAKLVGDHFTETTIVFKVTQTKSGGQHFGSRMVWLPDGTLLMTVGDGGNPPASIDGVLSRKLAQDMSSHLGKVLHLTDQGSPVDDPAFTNAQPEIYTAGHRNIQGLAYDPIRKTVWASEHGSRGGDEINRIRKGANYGWPKASYSKEYVLPMNVADATSLPGMDDPALVWMSRFAPSGLCLYTGKAFPNWSGDLLAGGLRSETIRVISLDSSGTVTGELNIPIGERVRDIRQGPDDLIYILTDEDDGKLIRLEPSGK